MTTHSEEKKSSLVFREPISRYSISETDIEQVLIQTESKFQNIKILKLKGLGKVLVLDHFTQSAEFDERIYHEALVHPAMFLFGSPKTVFIGGGGEGGTLREVLKHKSVEKVVMVDIDKELVDFCRKHLPEWSDGAFDDPRVELHYEDARNYLLNCKKEKKQSFDVVIMDICDPTKGSETVKLYQKEFYENLISSGTLNKGCIFVSQSGPCSQATIREVFSPIHRTLGEVFKVVLPYSTYINSFFDCWGFNIAFNDISFMIKQFVDGDIINHLINEQVGHKKLFFYDGNSHMGMFGFPYHLQKVLQEETRMITEKSPFYMNTEYEEEGGKIIKKE